MRTLGIALAVVLLGTGCTSRRVLQLENRLLRSENERLMARNRELEENSPSSSAWSSKPDLQVVASYLDRAGYVYEWTNDDRVLRLEYTGSETSFVVNIQHFKGPKVLFLATNDYLRVDDASDTRGVVMLLVKLAALNYDLLIGKFQLDPEAGDILLSAELHLDDGLGYDTFVGVLDQLTRTADDKYPELSRAAGGRGL